MDKEIIRAVIQEELSKERPSKRKITFSFLAKSILPFVLAVFTLAGIGRGCVQDADGVFQNSVRNVFKEEIEDPDGPFKKTVRGIVKEEFATVNGWMLTQFIFDVETQGEKKKKRPWDLNITDLDRLILTYTKVFPEEFKTVNLDAKVDDLKILKQEVQSGKYKKPKGAG